MSRLCYNPGAGRMLAPWHVMLAALMSVTCFSTSIVCAQGDGTPPRSPSVPTGPTAGSVPSAPRGPVIPKDSAGTGESNEHRMLDLAKRLATGETAEQPETVAAPASSASKSGVPATSTDADARAAASNQLKLADPDDKRPLSARVKHSEGALPDSSQQVSGSGSWLLNGITALGVVLILIFICRAVLRKAGVGGSIGPHPAVQVISRVPVAPRNHVLLIRVGQRVLVVGDSVAGLRTLSTIDDPEEVAEIITSAATAKPESITGGFRKMLSSFSGMYGRDEKETGGDESEYQVDRARDNVTGLVGRLRGGGGDA